MPPTNQDTFTLDPRLEADTAFIKAGPVSDFRLMDDERFPWIILVPRVSGLTALSGLPIEARQILIEESICAAQALGDVTGIDHVNIGALGNMVRQFHWHVVTRREGDEAWPGPVWGFGERQPYASDARDARVRALHDALP